MCIWILSFFKMFSCFSIKFCVLDPMLFAYVLEVFLRRCIDSLYFLFFFFYFFLMSDWHTEFQSFVQIFLGSLSFQGFRKPTFSVCDYSALIHEGHMLDIISVFLIIFPALLSQWVTWDLVRLCQPYLISSFIVSVLSACLLVLNSCSGSLVSSIAWI